MITIKIDPGKSRAILNFQKKGAKLFQQGLKRGIDKLGLMLFNQAKINSPIKRGHLRRSITRESSGLQAFVGTNVVYAPVHEFGAVIRPKNGKYLTFPINGSWVNATSVTIKPYKGRGYFRPAMKFIEKRASKVMFDSIRKAF